MQKRLSVLVVLVVFAAIAFVRHQNVVGEDLSSSYVGCKLLVAGQSSHLYSHDADLFNKVNDPLWEDIGRRAGFAPIGLLHPYVQTPLWAYTLSPICSRLSFPEFNKLFMFVGLVCLATTIWLVARFWTPHLMHPGWIALIAACLYVSEPFKYALFLNQTHIIFIVLAVAALILARINHPVAAGVVLAVAAAVKITPGFLVFYWLAMRQWRATISFVVSSTVLVVLTIFATGFSSMIAYLHNLNYVSNVLLVAFNNQSFAAWLLGRRYPANYFVWHIYTLPISVKLVSLLLMLACTVVGGVWDRKLWRLEASAAHWPPFGGVLAMIAATMLAPIAWTHYSLLLIVPVMFLLESNIDRKSPALIGLVICIFALNLYPFAIGAVLQHVSKLSVVRSQFYAGLLSLLGLWLLYARAQAYKNELARPRA